MSSPSDTLAASKARPLRVALFGNAVFSTFSGTAMLIMPDRIMEWLGIVGPTWPIGVIAAGLLLFAADLVHQATRPRVETWRALYAIAGDLMWVLATVAGLVLFGHHLTSLGLTLVAGVAMAVLGFSLWQAAGVLHAHKAEDGSGHRLRHCLVVRAAVPPDLLWQVVSDLGGIARFMPTLRSSMLRDDARPGVDAVRVCTDIGGRTWAERCVEFDVSARQVTLEFLCNEPGFPFPAVEMRGGWIVSDAGKEGSEVTVWWELTPRNRWMAVVLLPLLARQMDREIPAVVARMAESSGSDSLPRGPAKRLAQLLPRVC